MAECVVVIPCYNEARRLDLAAFIEHAARGDAALVFVNDGSTDGTAAILDDLCAASPELFSVLHLSHNAGKAEAVRRGMLQALERRPKYVGYWDADLATPLAAIRQMGDYLDAHPQVEALLGARVRLLGRRIERDRLRHCAGRLFAVCASFALRLPVYDTQCGAKLFRATDRIRQAFAEPFHSRWIFDVELLARLLASAAGEANCPAEDWIHEWPLYQWREVAGSKLRARDFLRAGLQLAHIGLRYRPALPGARRSRAVAQARRLPPDRAATKQSPAELESIR